MNFYNFNYDRDYELVSPGVKFDGVLIEDKLGREVDEHELKELVSNLSADYEMNPQDAQIDPVTKGIIPGFPGKKLDLEGTIDLIYNAKENEEVKPLLVEKKPEQTIGDLFPAPIYQGNPNKQRVSFICNVAWGTEHIDDLLRILHEYDTEISFFLEGKWARNNPQKVKKIYQEGHEIGNHAYSHYKMSTLNRDLVKEEIDKTNETIESILEEKINLFGPPAGDFDEVVLEEADDLGMYTIMWSLDTIDWTKPGEDYMVNKILDQIHSGAFILMHPTEDSVSALNEILPGLKEKSYKIVPVSKQLGI